MRGNTRQDRIGHDIISERDGVAPIVEKRVQFGLDVRKHLSQN